ncbi:glycoside hydrolase family 61 protein [Gelatoporia subvermispora B]|uniref:lytic cellulose monooxygenase (C4-dehydrogenating) n=1 Tax=Ceriporiopsis subvermispora (strain B) TaxID=914234 RepID=M2PI15_CERS8|nr:glycoside hydrolase family 61 protein [Gelatoporia subvermispora B]
MPLAAPAFLCFALALALSALPRVRAHGYVGAVGIDGTIYQGNVPNNPTGPSPIRLISTIDPVKGADNPNLSCGQNAQNAALVVPANPASAVTFAWSGGPGFNWPHNTGPLMTYMAECEGTTCDKYNATNAKWFKIDEVGKKSDGTTWVQQDIMNGANFTVNLPATLKAGQYLIRHEIIALHLATTIGGAEFYPSCTQVNVGGDQSGVPNATVSFPGAYSDTDPGIYDPDVFDAGAPYIFPGPPIASLITSNRDSTPISQTISPIASAASPSNSASPPNSAAMPSGSSSITSADVVCRITAQGDQHQQQALFRVPRHLARAVRRLVRRAGFPA